ncbi:DUF2782 domain-containing protein [Vogesella sp. LIG4]|uniref:DUF2782 domain-containing protein n=1 Tax=Vogesella sp. LIG4 TaxID=1192162 RepID=UPI0008200683|nr:DUF2782 domain-containing protein [Vogesella sp. LIG4]SCK15016.1 Protein of unknown function [Vogesella sp. LIG4]
MQRILLTSLLLVTVAAHAAPAQPPVGVEPEKQVTEYGNNSTVEELRRNGQVYQIKVNPNGAPSYMLLDEDRGMKPQSYGSDHQTLTPSWPLLSF